MKKVRMIESVLYAVVDSEISGICCNDVDGSNWFDARDSAFRAAEAMSDRIAELEAELEGLTESIRHLRALEDSYEPEDAVFDKVFLGLNQLCDGKPVQPAVPDGWQLMPKEPTEEMLDEARYSRECPVSGSDKSRDIYIAMLSAAPKENT